MNIQITLRDGRIGRDPSKIDDEGYGEILRTFESDRPFEVDELLNLPDGTEVKVLGCRETLLPQSWSQDLAVGDVFEVDKEPPSRPVVG